MLERKKIKAALSLILPSFLLATRIPTSRKVLYLTFDDGPAAEFSLALCDLLERYEAFATFFFQGNKIDQHYHIAEQIVARGHAIANHSLSHPDFSNISLAHQLQEVDECQARILKLNPDAKKAFRPPRGYFSLPLFLALVIRGWRIILWSVDSLDYKQGDLKRSLKQFSNYKPLNGDIILFHDDHNLAIEMLSELLPKWRSEGFEFEGLQV